jgi:NTE family protein
MIGLALSGGGSRAMAFHLGCLRALDDLGILERIGVLSTISGGSVIGAYYAYTTHLSFAEFESRIRSELRRGFLGRIALELAKPNNLLACLTSDLTSRVDQIGGVFNWKPGLRRYRSRTDMFRNVLDRDLFPKLSMSSPRRNDLEVVIGACELRTGTAFRFGNRKSGDWRHGEIITGDNTVAFAVASSAAYPLLLPALDRFFVFRRRGEEKEHRVLLTDGGVYDNLGVQVIEPDRDPAFSLHTFPCEYLIACNAGHGQESGQTLPTGFFTRVKQSFEIIHRRVQDSAMHRLHQLKQAGLIKGFAMPYLGQQDERLPWKPGNLVRRGDVLNYPTDFAAMREEWIDKLSARGEQLTRLLVSIYLPDLLEQPAIA